MNGTTADNATDAQLREREHTGLRTLDEHYGARQVYRALHCPYPGTDVLRTKARLRSKASSERARRNGGRPNGSDGATASKDRRGEVGASL